MTIPAPPPPAPPVVEEIVDVVIVPVVLPSEVVVAAPAPVVVGIGIGSGCSNGQVIAQAVSSDPPAMKALAELPASLRSDADAVMLWNGQWMTQPSGLMSLLGQVDPAEPIKQAVLMAVATLPPECRDALVRGPELLPIAEPGRTTMLAIGSGQWHWSDLLEPNALLPSAGQKTITG